MPMFDFHCEVCGVFRRVWRRADSPPRFCSRICQGRGRSAAMTGQAKHAKYPITPEMHAAIERVYREHTGDGEVAALAERLGLPRWKVTRYAIQQGWLAKQPKEPDWTEAELAILERHAHCRPEVISRRLALAGFKRSVTGVVLKRKRLKLLQNLEGQSARSVAQCFGVDVKTVTRWIDKGWLKARKRGTARTAAQGGDMWYIKDPWVRDFIKAYPEEVDLRKVDKFWFIDILTSNAAGQAQWGRAAQRDFEGVTGELDF